MNKNIIQLNNVVKTFHRGSEEINAVNGISFEVGQGSMVSIVGSSGSGKTTLLNMMGGVDSPTDGSLILDGKELTGLKEKQLGAV